jgi:hypothetical protein
MQIFFKKMLPVMNEIKKRRKTAAHFQPGNSISDESLTVSECRISLGAGSSINFSNRIYKN